MEVWFRSFSFPNGEIYRWTILIFQGVSSSFLWRPIGRTGETFSAKRSLPGATELESPQAAADPVEPRCLAAPWKLRKESPRTRGVSLKLIAAKTSPWKMDGFGRWYWLVVSNIFYVHPYLGEWSILTNIFQMGWNHQLGYHFLLGIKTRPFSEAKFVSFRESSNFVTSETMCKIMELFVTWTFSHWFSTAIQDCWVIF